VPWPTVRPHEIVTNGHSNPWDGDDNETAQSSFLGLEPSARMDAHRFMPPCGICVSVSLSQSILTPRSDLQLHTQEHNDSKPVPEYQAGVETVSPPVRLSKPTL
jgi:hypothetical protein